MTYAIVLIGMLLLITNEDSRNLLINVGKLCFEICIWVVVAIGLFGVAAWALSVI